MIGYYELKQGASGKWMFNLKAGNHEVILTSQSYETKQGAENGIDSVRKNGVSQSAYDKKVSSSGQHYFTLLATNKQIIGTSEMYSSEAARDNGIASVMKNCATEKVVGP
jgi:uncharacterized protein YegP (UPF0339 family)